MKTKIEFVRPLDMRARRWTGGMVRKRWCALVAGAIICFVLLISNASTVYTLLGKLFLPKTPLDIAPFEALFQMEQIDLKINDTEFSYNMSIPVDPNQCNGVEVVVYTMTLGDEKSFERRETVREVLRRTTNRSIIFRFFLGKSDDLNLTILIPEVQKYNDIVYYDHKDTYRENYAKWYTINEYHLRHCPNVTHVIKMDHDVAVDYGRFFEWLDLDFGGLLTNHTEYFLCQEMRGYKPYRKLGDRWYISWDEYPRRWWPNYCYGYFVLTTTETIASVQHGMRDISLVHMDDAFITGIVRKNLSIPIINWHGIFSQPEHVSYENCDLLDTIHSFFVVHNVTHRELAKGWIEDMRTLEC
ncbi:unnamed protein product [Bursaphelenchus xylophilus]|uniref:Hexosyltransferase n=2 Tax=Bursaphelenchus xylophilus TaxID=6326 RepID=A0A7I8XH23_BURXY|nr:unnamed protein product [Bursaphelenchus xylophilus]CAG9079583.1 unnamed protein product [Bursaphelenchus xylophilus]